MSKKIIQRIVKACVKASGNGISVGKFWGITSRYSDDVIIPTVGNCCCPLACLLIGDKSGPRLHKHKIILVGLKLRRSRRWVLGFINQFDGVLSREWYSKLDASARSGARVAILVQKKLFEKKIL